MRVHWRDPPVVVDLLVTGPLNVDGAIAGLGLTSAERGMPSGASFGPGSNPIGPEIPIGGAIPIGGGGGGATNVGGGGGAYAGGGGGA